MQRFQELGFLDVYGPRPIATNLADPGPRSQLLTYVRLQRKDFSPLSVQRHLTSASTHRTFRAGAMGTWREAVTAA
jgi:hypothetical protein